MKNNIHDFDFDQGKLVLVRNSKFDKGLGDKTKPRYFGPLVVIKRTKGGSYILAELDGSLSKLRFAAFRLLPYHPRNLKAVPVTRDLLEQADNIEELTNEADVLDNEDQEEI